MNCLRFALIALTLCSAPCLAHVDHLLALGPDGGLAGLPPPYAPGRLKLGFAEVEGDRRLTALSLEVHGKRVELPMCVLGLINTARPDDVA